LLLIGRALLLTGGGDSWLATGDTEKLKVSREEELYKQEMIRLEKDLTLVDLQFLVGDFDNFIFVFLVSWRAQLKS
jgi:hypothetical protein